MNKLTLIYHKLENFSETKIDCFSMDVKLVQTHKAQYNLNCLNLPKISY